MNKWHKTISKDTRTQDTEKTEIVAKAQQKLQEIITRIAQGNGYYSRIQQECLGAVFFAFPAITPKLLAVLERHFIASHDLIDESAISELRALLADFNVANCKRS